MKLKYITFIFENCDSITIDGKYVGDFIVDDIQTSIQRIASNAINKIDTANIFAIEIHKDANKERYQHDQIQIENFKQMTFDRFTSWQDVTSIEFELEDSYEEEERLEHYDYCLNWFGDDKNLNQKVYISKCGNLYLVVADSTSKKFCDFFDGEMIDDKEYMDFHFDMCDVGDKNE